MKNESKYLKRFKKVKSRLKGNYVLVELLPNPEAKTKGGIILSDGSKDQIGSAFDNTPCYCVVLQTGPGYYDSDGVMIEESMELKVGNVFLTSKASLKIYSVMPGLMDYQADTIGLTSDTEAQMVFDDMDDLNRYFEECNK